jgi:NAD(P)H-hydrate repair Nnr-like enzyme with NAD(P)H-hydrate epimerase domain
MSLTSVNRMTIPTVTTDQMRLVDRLMIEKYGIGLLQMMENAGESDCSVRIGK